MVSGESDIYMKNNVNKGLFSVVWCVCLVGLFIIIFIGYNISKGTNAYFGDPENGSGNLGGEIYSVYYYRNWPNIEDIEYVQDKKYNITKIINYDELFDLLDGYLFIGWNTLSDGSGISFDVDTTFRLTADMNLYAQWRLIVAYGDVNEDGVINEDDYLLIEKHVNDESILVDKSLVNADVNNNGIVDLVDVDIVKQVCLGTVGYVGYLPDKPILKYDIYEGNVDIGTDNPVVDEDTGNDEGENKNENVLDNNSSNSNVSSGNATSNVGSGNQSFGTSQGGSSSNNGGTNDGDDTNNNDINDNQEDISTDGNNEDIDNDISENTFKFKFMNGNLEYANSECIINDGECLLVLPRDNPKIDGYRFTGWSEELGCPDNRGILKSVYVNSDKVYYACFVDNMDWKNVYLIIIIFLICFTAFMTIWNLIINFNKENIINNDSSQ